MDDVAFLFTFFLLIQLCKFSSVFDNALIYFISAQTVLFIHHWMLFLKTSIISEPLWSGEAVNQKFGEQSREAWLSYLTSKWLTKLTPRLIPLPSRSVIVFKGTALKNYPPPLFLLQICPKRCYFIHELWKKKITFWANLQYKWVIFQEAVPLKSIKSAEFFLGILLSLITFYNSHEKG